MVDVGEDVLGWVVFIVVPPEVPVPPPPPLARNRPDNNTGCAATKEPIAVFRKNERRVCDF